MFTEEQIRSSLTALSPTIQRLLFSRYVEDGHSITAGTALLFWTADLLTQLQPVDADQRNLILDSFESDLRKLGDRLGELTTKKLAVGDKLPACKLGFADRRFVYITGRDGLLDLLSGEEVKGMGKMPVEELYYNLTTLYMKHKVLLDARETVEKKKRPDHAHV